jgi:hypothetical protein
MRQGYGRRTPVVLTADDQADLQEQTLQGAAAGQLADFAEKVLLGDQERSIRRRIFAQIDSDEPLDPLKAAQAWIELRAVHKLVARLHKAAQAGQVASQTLSDRTPESE